MGYIWLTLEIQFTKDSWGSEPREQARGPEETHTVKDKVPQGWQQANVLSS